MTSESFPPDIIREILLKASVKSLLRCKAVCKEWYSLISNQHFIKSHYILSSTNNINFAHHRLIYNIYQRENDLYSCSLYDVLFNEDVNNVIKLKHPLQRAQLLPIKIVGSCDGLVCLFVEDDSTLFIYNPSTRTTNIFPPFEQGPGRGFVSYGFGYDETAHDYKVVKSAGPYWGTMIYSFKAGSWKEIDGFSCLSPLNDGKFLNGALHWASIGEHTWHIVSLDLGKETYGEVLQPEYDGKGCKTCHLGVLGESLCVICDYCENRVVDVWVMKVYGVKDSWTKLACIPYPSDIWWDQMLEPLCISNDGKVLFKGGSKLLVYDSKDSSSKIIDNFDGCRQACIVVESLVSPFPPLGLADNNDDEN